MTKNIYLQSPLNYTGGKFKLLPQIIPYFPQNINTFVDLFCGGGNVGCNIVSERVIFNDIEPHVINLLSTLKKVEEDVIFNVINSIIDKYNLSRVDKNGYDFYKCDSSNGVASYNKDKFIKLREYFNDINPPFDDEYYLMFYTILVFAFNNQIRFNSKGEYNMPVGKRDFNEKMQTKLKLFINKLKNINCIFTNNDFRKLKVEKLNNDDFVYCDPPYLITTASYNESNGWTEKDEIDLLDKLSEINDKGIKFALSNVLTSKNKKNNLLSEWLLKNPKYNCVHLNYNYSNSNYHTKNRETDNTDEILIKNY